MSLNALRASLIGTALAATAIAVTGCGSSTSSALGTGATAATGASSAATPASSVPVSTAPAGTPAASTTPAAAAPSPCATADLRITLGTGGAAAGTGFTVVDFTNVGAVACTLYGYPGASLTDASGAQIGAPASRDAVNKVALVTLPPGGIANATFAVGTAEDYPTATCTPENAAHLKIYPPNQTQPVVLPYKSTGCQNSAVDLIRITAVIPGAGKIV